MTYGFTVGSRSQAGWEDWESYMPLARVALYQKGISLYISPNTNDNEEWQNTIRHIAIEGHCFFINADMYFTREIYPETAGAAEEIRRLPDIVCRGGSLSQRKSLRSAGRRVSSVAHHLSARQTSHASRHCGGIGVSGNIWRAIIFCSRLFRS